MASLAKALKVSVSAVQAATLATRSDFLGFVGVSGKKVKKPEVLASMASSMSLLASDSSIQEILKRYQNVSDAAKKEFAKSALGMLS